MGIVEDDIDRVRNQSDLIAVVSEHVAVRKSGSRWIGLCPFHAEKTASFSVNPELGVYYCHGCQAKGDAITFVRETQHLDFVGAVEWLASRAGVTLRYDNNRESGERKRRSVLVEAMGKAVEWYHHRLLHDGDAAPARGYLRSRGIDGAAVRRFMLGWAPSGWDEMCQSLRLPLDVAKETGLGFENARGRLQDSFRDRVLFPIFDSRGDPVALGGRVMPGAGGPKYKNSASTAIYDKSQVLYGMHLAKASVVTAGEVVVCEGYTDVIGFWRAGIDRAVATCGTALTESHLGGLRRFARRIVLAFDADSAGIGAAERLYEWERRHDVDIHVASLSAGTDPDEMAVSDPEGLRKAVETAQPFLAFRLDRLLEGAGQGAGSKNSAESRAKLAEQARQLIVEHPNQIVREQYASRVAAQLEVDPRHLVRRQWPESPSRGTTSPRPQGARDSSALMALRLAVHRPEAVVDHLHEVLFADLVHLDAFRALYSSTTLHQAIATAGPEAAELLQRLAVEEADAEADDVLALLVGDVAGRAMAGMTRRAMAEFTPKQGTDLTWLKQRLLELSDRERRMGAVDALVAFLTEQGKT